MFTDQSIFRYFSRKIGQFKSTKARLGKDKFLIQVVFQGRVVRKPVKANTGLKVNQSISISCIKMLFTAYVLCSLR